MDEGLGFALIPIFVIVLPIVISSFILYFILRNKKLSIQFQQVYFFILLFQLSIVGFVVMILRSSGHRGYVSGLFWYLSQIVGGSQLAPFLILIVSSMLTAFMGLIFIKIFRKVK